ncbi:MAG: hypothetical protein M1122_00365 [Candidatus Marsarchaeota archaeon]|jgi:hypothetical protein|nr:hypothetical protein [Candidatus Marsarchaeota archaeon]
MNQEKKESRIKAYIILGVVLIALALISIALVPRGSSVNRCSSILNAQDRYACLSNLAFETNNASICSLISQSYSSQCYMDIAESNYNSSLCSMVQGSESDSCIMYIANATENYQTCGLANGSAVWNCMESIAVKTSNLTACYSIENSNTSSECTSLIYFNKALFSQNGEYCSNVSNDQGQNVSKYLQYTISNASDISAGFSSIVNAGLPEYILGASGYNYTPRDLCYIRVAQESYNQTYCDNLQNKTAYNICYYESARNIAYNQTNNTVELLNYTEINTLCEQYGGQNVQTCINTFMIAHAVETKNLTECSLFNTTTMQYQCYSSLAQAYKNVTYCGYIDNATVNNACVGNVEFNFTTLG